MAKKGRNGRNGESHPGRAVDLNGNSVVDPTRNVLDLVDAAVTRQDDLRAADGRFRDAQAEHLREMAELRAQHAKELRVIETERINAIREVDTQNVSRAAEVAAAQADALRGQVEAARIAVADTLSTALKPIQDDIASLRQTQYEQAGQKAAAVDPQAVAIAAIQATLAAQGGAQGQLAKGTADNRWMYGAAVAAVSILVSVIVLIVLLTKG
jgi:hypothetical protein